EAQRRVPVGEQSHFSAEVRTFILEVVARSVVEQGKKLEVLNGIRAQSSEVVAAKAENVVTGAAIKRVVVGDEAAAGRRVEDNDVCTRTTGEGYIFFIEEQLDGGAAGVPREVDVGQAGELVRDVRGRKRRIKQTGHEDVRAAAGDRQARQAHGVVEIVRQHE